MQSVLKTNRLSRFLFVTAENLIVTAEYAENAEGFNHLMSESLKHFAPQRLMNPSMIHSLNSVGGEFTH